MVLSSRKKTDPRALGPSGQVKSCPESLCCATVENLCYGPISGARQKRLMGNEQEVGLFLEVEREELGRNKQVGSSVSGWKDPRE